MEENNIRNNEGEIADKTKKYFVSFTKTLNLKKQITPGNGERNEFESHISSKIIHRKYPEIVSKSFKFELVSDNDVKKEIENLNTKKSSTYSSIRAAILKQCVDAYLRHHTDSINYYFQRRTFPQEL